LAYFTLILFFRGLFAALVVLVTILFLLPVFSQLPKAVMSSIVVSAALGLIDIQELQFFIKIRAWKDVTLVVVTICITGTLHK
jgi:MFS superfamily sulfate permease-like transporter